MHASRTDVGGLPNVLTILIVGSALLLSGTPVTGQCALSVRPVDSELGYKQRAGGYCEGLYVGLQSAPVNLQVISLLPANAEGLLNRSGEVLIRLPDSAPDAVGSGSDGAGPVEIYGRAVESNLNWAFTHRANWGQNVRWDVQHIREGAPTDSLRIDGRRLGLVARATDARGDIVFVPLDLSPESGAGTFRGPTDPPCLELVFKIPSGSRPDVFFDPEPPEDGGCTTGVQAVGSSTGVFDGYWSLAIPNGLLDREYAGSMVVVDVRWRASGRIDPDAPVQSLGYDQVKILTR